MKKIKEVYLIDRDFSDLLKKQNIPFTVESVLGTENTCAYKYKSPAFGDVVAISTLVRVSCDSFTCSTEIFKK